MASSSINGFARSCRALMAAAKGSASATAEKAAVAGGEAPRGIQKPVPLSPTLSKFVGSPEASRGQVTKKIWEYIKLNNLQNPEEKRQILCDDKLKELFGGKDKVGMFEIATLLKPHFVKN